MGKKKRPRKLRRKLQKLRNKPNHESSHDLHHLCWPRKKWNNGFAREIRNHWYFKVMIPKNTLHYGIHTLMVGIPMPDSDKAKKAYHRLSFLEAQDKLNPNDSVEKRLRLLASFFPDTATGRAFIEQLNIVQNYSPQ